MALDRDYFEYPHRGPGMDHDFYEWSMLEGRPPVAWPDGARIALWVNVGLQFFPLDQAGKPFAPPGGMTTAYPDLRHFTLRDYGNRVGIFRFLKAFDRLGIRATFAVNTALAERCPYLVERLVERGDEITCHGRDMDSPHFGGMDRDAEAELVDRSLGSLRRLTGQPIRGWISPGRSQSIDTPALLVENGIEYMCDWINDDMPYRFSTASGPIIAMPLSLELEDRFIIMNNLHAEAEYTQQICDAFDFLYAEAADQGGRMLALSIHPWMLGQPHRIGALEAALSYIMGRGGVWSAGAGEICRAWQASA